jgi:hypothetical protein
MDSRGKDNGAAQSSRKRAENTRVPLSEPGTGALLMLANMLRTDDNGQKID